MRTVGRVESLWRYPVKSMAGEQLESAFVGFSGVYGDRCHAFLDSAASAGFPYLTARQNQSMLLYHPSYRHAERMNQPPNIAEAVAVPPGATPVYPDLADLVVDVRTPPGEVLAIDDPKLLVTLEEGLNERHSLRLHSSHRAMTDCRPVSLFSMQTREVFSKELGTDLDKRRFRANIYVELKSGLGFQENEFIGRTLQIGVRTVIAFVDRDPRCKMITLDPDTGEANPEIMRLLAKSHEGKAGIYGAVLVEGTIRPGDPISLLQ